MKLSFRYSIIGLPYVVKRGLASMLRELTDCQPFFSPRSDLDFIRTLSSLDLDMLLCGEAFLNEHFEEIEQLIQSRGIRLVLFSETPHASLPTVSSHDTIEDLGRKLFNDKQSQINETELSQREKEVLCKIAEGFTNKEIADKLFLSAHTVATHRKNIIAKLNIHSAAGLTLYALANGYIQNK